MSSVHQLRSLSPSAKRHHPLLRSVISSARMLLRGSTRTSPALQEKSGGKCGGRSRLSHAHARMEGHGKATGSGKHRNRDRPELAAREATRDECKDGSQGLSIVVASGQIRIHPSQVPSPHVHGIDVALHRSGSADDAPTLVAQRCCPSPERNGHGRRDKVVIAARCRWALFPLGPPRGPLPGQFGLTVLQRPCTEGIKAVWLWSPPKRFRAKRHTFEPQVEELSQLGKLGSVVVS